MINPNENDFIEDDPLAASTGPLEQGLARRRAGRSPKADRWKQTKDRATDARDRAEFFLRENPVPTIVGALAVGLAIGWALRHATSSEAKEEVKTPLGEINLGFLSLPFLWPFFKSVRKGYEESAETLKDGVDRLRRVDIPRYAKPLRKRWKAWTN